MPAKSTQSKHPNSTKFKKAAKPHGLKQAIRSNYAQGGKNLSLASLKKVAKTRAADNHSPQQLSQQPSQNRQPQPQSQTHGAQTRKAQQTQAQARQTRTQSSQPQQPQQLDQATQLDILDSVLSQVETKSANKQSNLNPGLVGQALPQADQYWQQQQVKQQAALGAGRVSKEQAQAQSEQRVQPVQSEQSEQSEQVRGQVETQSVPNGLEAQVEAQSAPNSLEALSSLETQADTGIEVVGSSQAVEQEPSPELSPEVEKYIKKVKNNQIQPPKEVVVANQDTAPTSQSQYVSKPVIVLPITPQLEKKGQRKPPKFSIRWLVAWSQKIMKKFVGEVIYRQPAGQPAG
jgi:hypothetical protein